MSEGITEGDITQRSDPIPGKDKLISGMPVGQ